MKEETIFYLLVNSILTGHYLGQGFSVSAGNPWLWGLSYSWQDVWQRPCHPLDVSTALSPTVTTTDVYRLYQINLGGVESKPPLV